jgi:hypothetical protein
VKFNNFMSSKQRAGGGSARTPVIEYSTPYPAATNSTVVNASSACKCLFPTQLNLQ